MHYAISRRLSAGRQLVEACGMVDAGRVLAIAGLRLRYPEASEAQLQRLWAQEYQGEALYRRVNERRAEKNICA